VIGNRFLRRIHLLGISGRQWPHSPGSSKSGVPGHGLR
jgi:hypothetical protein